MKRTSASRSPHTDPARARDIRIQRAVVIGFAVVEAVVIAWALFR